MALKRPRGEGAGTPSTSGENDTTSSAEQKLTKKEMLAFAVGAVLLLALAIFAFRVQTTNSRLDLMFRVTLALSVAGIAAILPGAISYRLRGKVQAVGSLAVFALLVSTNPRSLLDSPPRLVEATPSVNCSEEYKGACIISVSVAYHGQGSLVIGPLQYRIVVFEDLGGTLGPAFVPEQLGDLDLSPAAQTPWLSARQQEAQPLAKGEGTAVVYRVTAKHLLRGHFGFWTLEAKLNTSSGDIPLGNLELMLPYWDSSLYKQRRAAQ